MGRPTQQVSVDRTTRSTLGTGTASPANISTGWPVGDVLYKRLGLHIRTVVSVATAMVTRGRAIFLREINFSTDKHGPVVENVDGIMAQQLSWFLNPQGQGHRLPAEDADDDHYLILPFEDREAARPEDTVLDMLKARPTLNLTWGNAADIESTAGTTLSNLDHNTEVDIDPGPVDIGKEGPLLMPHLSSVRVPISQTTAGFIIELPYGDRIYKRVLISQRNGSTRAELNNTVVGAAATDRVSLFVNGFPWVNRNYWLDLQNANFQDYQRYDAARGVAAIEFGRSRSGGAKLADALSTVSPVTGRMTLELDVTSVTNGQLWLGLQSAKPIPAQALRPAPAPQT